MRPILLKGHERCVPRPRSRPREPLTPRETREGLILFRRFAQGLCGAPSQIALPSEPPLTVTVPVTFYHPGL